MPYRYKENLEDLNPEELKLGGKLTWGLEMQYGNVLVFFVIL